MDDRSQRMLVMGAGPCGLAVAKGLLKHQIPDGQFFRERRLRARFNAQTRPELQPLVTTQANPDIQVY